MSDTKKAADAAANASLQEEMDAVMRKYDRESATRVWTGKPKIVISVVMALFSIYCIWSTLFSTAALEIRLTAFLGLIVIMGYLTYPASKKHGVVKAIVEACAPQPPAVVRHRHHGHRRGCIFLLLL